MPNLSADTALLLAIKLLDDGKPEPAREISEKVLAVRPDHEQALLLKIMVMLRDGRTAEAEAAFRRLYGDAARVGTPRSIRPQPGPRLLDPLLLHLFGGERPPVSDISDHLPTLFFEAAAARPRLVVELGTRGGESTRALLAATLKSGGRMLSIDIDPCDPAGLPEDARAVWSFVQSDDVAFGRERFTGWCAERGLPARIDVLFIDTSHLYEHTRDELAVWMPFVAPGGTVLLHDTAMAHAYLHNDATISLGWDNDRGVIRAIEEHLGRRYDETGYFVDGVGEWLVRHDPKSSGFTVLRRLG